MSRKNVIAFDFDGVIHKYSKGFYDGTLYDPPIDGVREIIQELIKEGYEIMIYSCRSYDHIVNGELRRGQKSDMQDYLKLHQIPYSYFHDGKGKPVCDLIIDDNVYRFSGNWKTEIKEIKRILSK